MPLVYLFGSIHHEENSLHRSPLVPRGENIWVILKEAHNGRQRRQKGQRQAPETEGKQTGKRSKREAGQTTEKRTEIIDWTR